VTTLSDEIADSVLLSLGIISNIVVVSNSSFLFVTVAVLFESEKSSIDSDFGVVRKITLKKFHN
jgi:hypothetical protein